MAKGGRTKEQFMSRTTSRSTWQRERESRPAMHARTGLVELGLVTHSLVLLPILLLLIEEHCSPSLSLLLQVAGRQHRYLLPPFPSTNCLPFNLCSVSRALRRPSDLNSEARISSPCIRPHLPTLICLPTINLLHVI
jgi:hypothetical protein